jgi:hypothetical protein
MHAPCFNTESAGMRYRYEKKRELEITAMATGFIKPWVLSYSRRGLLLSSLELWILAFSNAIWPDVLSLESSRRQFVAFSL